MEGGKRQGVKTDMMEASEPRQSKCRQIVGHADACTQCHLCYHECTHRTADGARRKVCPVLRMRNLVLSFMEYLDLWS